MLELIWQGIGDGQQLISTSKYLSSVYPHPVCVVEKQCNIDMNEKQVLIAADLLTQREKTFDKNNILYSTFLHYVPSTIF